MGKSEKNALPRRKAFDKSYSIVIYGDGSMCVVFGDGKKGARPPDGNIIAAAYRQGSKEIGKVANEKPKGIRQFSSKMQAIEFLCGKMVSELKANLPEEQGDTVYLEVWERDPASLDDPTIRETANGGLDTNIRIDETEGRKKKSG